MEAHVWDKFERFSIYYNTNLVYILNFTIDYTWICLYIFYCLKKKLNHLMFFLTIYKIRILQKQIALKLIFEKT